MSKYEYSDTAKDVFKVYLAARSFIALWIFVVFVYALGEEIYFGTNEFTTLNKYWPLSINDFSNILYLFTISCFLLVSKSLPIFFMFFYTILSFRASKVIGASAAKSVLVFWFVQAFNFVYILPDESGMLSLEIFDIDPNDSLTSMTIMLVTASPFALIALVRMARERFHPVRNSFNAMSESSVLMIPHSIYIAVVSAIIALLFDVNLQIGNLAISNGVLFGLALSLIILPKQDLQKILLFFIAPETYHYVHQEMEAVKRLEENKLKSQMVSRGAEIGSLESLASADAAQQESKNKMRQLVSSAGKKFVEAKYHDTEQKIKLLSEQLESGQIDMETYSASMTKIMEEANETYRDIARKKIDSLPQ